MAVPARPASPQVRADAEIVCFLDGDGSDVPRFLADIVGPVARGEADFVMGSRLRGRREPGSMTPQQLVAGRLAGALMRLVYGVRFTDMSPFRAMRVDQLRRLGMARRPTAGTWRCRCAPPPPGCASARSPSITAAAAAACRRSPATWPPASGAAWKISTTFLRLAVALRGAQRQRLIAAPVSRHEEHAMQNDKQTPVLHPAHRAHHALDVGARRAAPDRQRPAHL